MEFCFHCLKGFQCMTAFRRVSICRLHPFFKEQWLPGHPIPFPSFAAEQAKVTLLHAPKCLGFLASQFSRVPVERKLQGSTMIIYSTVGWEIITSKNQTNYVQTREKAAFSQPIITLVAVNTFYCLSNSQIVKRSRCKATLYIAWGPATPQLPTRGRA